MSALNDMMKSKTGIGTGPIVQMGGNEPEEPTPTPTPQPKATGTQNSGSNVFTDPIQFEPDKANLKQNFIAAGPQLNYEVPGDSRFWNRPTQPTRGYWENPAVITRYNNLLEAAPSDWVAPRWMNAPMIKSTYDYMKWKNHGKDWQEWEPLPFDNPLAVGLRGLEVPPDDMQWEEDRQFTWAVDMPAQNTPRSTILDADGNEIDPWAGMGYDKAQDITDYNGWQRLYLGLFSPQAEIAGRNPVAEELSKWGLGTAVQSSIGAIITAGNIGKWAGLGVGSLFGQPAAGMAIGKTAGRVAGALLAVPTTIIQNRTGKEVPVLSDLLQMMDTGERAVKAVVGVGMQIGHEGLTEVFEDLPAAIVASEAIYNAGNYDLLAQAGGRSSFWGTFLGGITNGQSIAEAYMEAEKIYETLNPQRSDFVAAMMTPWPKLLRTGEFNKAAEADDPLMVYQLAQGYTEPVPAMDAEGNVITLGDTGPEALQEAREGIEGKVKWSDLVPWLAVEQKPEDVAMLMADFTWRFGDSGQFNDLVMTTLTDSMDAGNFTTMEAGRAAALLAGNPRLAAAFEAGQGDLIVDLAPFGIKQALAALGGRESKGLSETMQTYAKWIQTGYSPDGSVVPAAAELSGFEKWAAGLDEQGQIKALQPRTEAQGALSGLRNWVNRMASLTPDSQAGMSLENFIDSIGVAVLANDNPNLTRAERAQNFTKILEQLASGDPFLAGSIGEQITNSPVWATAQAVYNKALQGETLTTQLTKFLADQSKIDALENAAKLLGTHVSRLVEDLGKHPDATWQQLTQAIRQKAEGGDKTAQEFVKAMEAGTLNRTAFLDEMAIFTGTNSKGEKANHHAWTYEEWQAETLNQLADQAEKALIAHYGVKPGGVVSRLAQTLKAVQSMLLLDLNPSYLINNVLNNYVTGAAEGVFGFLTLKQADAFLDRLGIAPMRLGEPTHFDSINQRESDQYHPMERIRRASEGDGALTKFKKQLGKLRGQFGLMSKLSSMMEQTEGKRAFVIGMQKSWTGLWKEGVGYAPMPAALEQALAAIDPALPMAVKDAVRNSMNPQELYGQFFESAKKVNVQRMIEEAAAALDPAGAEQLIDLVRSMGLDQRLGEALDQAETVEDVARAFRVARRDAEDAIAVENARKMMNRVEELQEQIKSGGFIKAAELLLDVELMQYDALDSSYGERQEIADMDFPEWERQFKRDTARFRKVAEHVITLTGAILQQMGADSAVKAQFVGAVTEKLQTWQDVYNGYDLRADGSRASVQDQLDVEGKLFRHVDGKNDLLRRFFDTTYDNKAMRDAAWEQTQTKIRELMQHGWEVEFQTRDRMAGQFEQLWNEHNGSGKSARAWWDVVTNIRREMQRQQDVHQIRLDKIGKDKARRDEENKHFYEKVYRPLVKKLAEDSLRAARKHQQYNNEQGGKRQAPAAPGAESESTTPEPMTLEEEVKAALEIRGIDLANRQIAREAEAAWYGMLDRKIVLDGMQQAYHLQQDQMEAVRMLMDLRAEQWAEENKRKPEQWWSVTFADFVADEGSGIALSASDQAAAGGQLQQVGEAGDINSENFKRWFADSKVVDEEGNPLVVYHGTTAEFEAFDFSQVRTNGTSEGVGFYFTDKIEIAGGYTRGKQQPLAVYLSMKKPMTQEQRQITRAQLRKLLLEIHRVAQETDQIGLSNYGDVEYEGLNSVINTALNLEWDNETDVDLISSIGNSGALDWETLNRIVKQVTGYDGVIVNWDHTTPASKVYVVFTPEQIKHVNNRGTWNPDDANMYHQTAQAAATIKGGTQFIADGRAILRGMKAADLSTALHEMAHVFRRQLPKADLQIWADWTGMKLADLLALQEVFDNTPQDEWAAMNDPRLTEYIAAEEKFARGFERWLYEGMPETFEGTKRIVSLFHKLADWLHSVYQAVIGSPIDVDVSDEMRGVFTRMLGIRSQRTVIKSKFSEFTEPRMGFYHDRMEAKRAVERSFLNSRRTEVEDIWHKAVLHVFDRMGKDLQAEATQEVILSRPLNIDGEFIPTERIAEAIGLVDAQTPNRYTYEWDKLPVLVQMQVMRAFAANRKLNPKSFTLGQWVKDGPAEVIRRVNDMERAAAGMMSTEEEAEQQAGREAEKAQAQVEQAARDEAYTYEKPLYKMARNYLTENIEKITVKNMDMFGITDYETKDGSVQFETIKNNGGDLSLGNYPLYKVTINGISKVYDVHNGYEAVIAVAKAMGWEPDADTLVNKAGFLIEDAPEAFPHGDYLVEKIWYLPPSKELTEAQRLMGEEGELIPMVYVPAWRKDGSPWVEAKVEYHEAGLRGVQRVTVVGIDPANPETLMVENQDGSLTRVPRRYKGMELFQAGEAVERQGNLIALHNLSEDQLLSAYQLGGFAVPSIAITKPEIAFDKYGTITLIGNRSLIDPEVNPDNRVFDADIYSPTFPKRKWKKVKLDIADQVMNKLRPYFKEVNDEPSASELWDTMVNSPNRDEMKYRLSSSYGGRYAFIKENNIPYEIPVKPATKPNELDDQFRSWLIENEPDNVMSRYEEYVDNETDDFGKAFTEQFVQAVERFNDRLIAEAREDEIDKYKEWKKRDIENLLISQRGGVFTNYIMKRYLLPLYQVIKNESVLDRVKLDETLNKVIEEHNDEFTKWVEKITDVYGEPTITVRGKQMPVTLSNVVEAMITQNIKGGEDGLTYGPGRVRAVAATEIKSVDMMHEYYAKNLKPDIVVQSFINGEQKNALEHYSNLADKHYKFNDVWDKMNSQYQALAEYAKKHYIHPNVNGMRAVLRKYNFENIDKAFVDSAFAAVEVIVKAPTLYMEAKPQRGVGFYEFPAAVVPENTNPQVIDVLNRFGIEYAYYKDGDTDSRQTTVNTLANRYNLLFQTAQMEGNGTVKGGEAAPLGEAMQEVYERQLRPMLTAMERNALNQWNTKQSIGQAPLGADAEAMLQEYLKQVEQQMPGTKLAAMRGGEQMRDNAMLNYNQRYGFDGLLEVLYPYQFWYTRSFLQWARRMIDKPQWLRMYAKLRKKQEEYEKKGIPTRLKGKMRFFAPYLPDWAGNMGWYDPLRVLFPFEGIFGKPLEQMQMNESRQRQTTFEILRAQREAGEITDEEYSEAVDGQSNYAWGRAYAMAGEQVRNDTGGVLGLADMMMGKALYIDVPLKLLNDQANEISVLPITRSGQAIESIFKNTALESSVGKIGSLMAGFERNLRQKAGLNEFGAYGEYYIDRQLANMAAENPLLTTQVQEAMISRQGELYEEAYQRVAEEMAMRVPGTLQAEAIKAATQGNANALDILGAMFAGLFPMTLVGEGELRYRELADEYSQAWDKYNAGDTGAVNQFFEEHPEYEARLALFDEPEERLQQFLVSNIWEAYTALDGPNRSRIADSIPGFADAFLNTATRDYSAFTTQELANIAATLRGQSTVIGTLTGTALPTPDVVSDPTNQAVQAYWDAREEAWPGATQMEQMYYNQGKPAELEGYLQGYWDWKAAYMQAHPEVQGYYQQEKLNRIYEQYPAAIAQDIEAYLYDYERRYGSSNIKEIEQGYFDEGKSRAYLQQHPELKEYWDWKRAWREQSQGVNLYLDEYKLEAAEAGAELTETIDLTAIPNTLLIPLMVQINGGQVLNEGSQELLRQIWKEQGQPGGSMEGYMQMIADALQ